MNKTVREVLEVLVAVAITAGLYASVWDIVSVWPYWGRLAVAIPTIVGITWIIRRKQ